MDVELLMTFDVNSEQRTVRILLMGGVKEQLREHIKASVEICFVYKFSFSLSWSLATVRFVHKVQRFLSSGKERHIVSQWIQIN
jgi:hypothetical protein